MAFDPTDEELKGLSIVLAPPPAGPGSHPLNPWIGGPIVFANPVTNSINPYQVTGIGAPTPPYLPNVQASKWMRVRTDDELRANGWIDTPFCWKHPTNGSMQHQQVYDYKGLMVDWGKAQEIAPNAYYHPDLGTWAWSPAMFIEVDNKGQILNSYGNWYHDIPEVKRCEHKYVNVSGMPTHITMACKFCGIDMPEHEKRCKEHHWVWNKLEYWYDCKHCGERHT